MRRSTSNAEENSGLLLRMVRGPSGGGLEARKQAKQRSSGERRLFEGQPFFFFSYEVTSLKPDQRILEPEDQHRVYGVVDSARVRYAVSVSRQE